MLYPIKVEYKQLTGDAYISLRSRPTPHTRPSPPPLPVAHALPRHPATQREQDTQGSAALCLGHTRVKSSEGLRMGDEHGRPPMCRD